MSHLHLRCLLVLAVALGGYVQGRARTEDDGRVWLHANIQGTLPWTDFGWFVEAQGRWREEGDALDQASVRPAVLYRLNPETTAWLGYAHVVNHPSGGETRDETRIWVQVVHTLPRLGAFTVQSRTRLERREFEGASDTGYRLRQQFRLSRPIPGHTRWSFVLSNEIHFGLADTDWGPRTGFDQNRFFVGVSGELTATTRIETGYLNQFQRGSRVDRMNHVLATTLSTRF